MSEFVLAYVNIAGRVQGSEPGGRYLAYYDPDWRPPGAPISGLATWTDDVDEAMKFASPQAALQCYLQQSKTVPFRADGQENRPLTAYTVEVVAAVTAQ